MPDFTFFVYSLWMFIVFEGLDGSGKSTLIKSFINELKKHNVGHCFTKDPGGTEVGDKIRDLILDKSLEPEGLTELLLYQASRAELVKKVILPCLKDKKWVISDRFYPSTLSFQGYARGIDVAKINWLNKLVTDKCKPDYVVWVDTPVEVCQERLMKRDSEGEDLNRLDQEKVSFHKKVYEGYKAQSLLDKDTQWIVLDGNKSQEELFSDFFDRLGSLWTKV